jgi:ribosome-binding protein aMBF1 (putative translation factor)
MANLACELCGRFAAARGRNVVRGRGIQERMLLCGDCWAKEEPRTRADNATQRADAEAERETMDGLAG